MALEAKWERIQLNNYMKCTENYLACGVSYAGHLANIYKSNPDKILTAIYLDTLCENISMLKTPPCDKDIELFECIRHALNDPKEKLDNSKRRVESIKSK